MRILFQSLQSRLVLLIIFVALPGFASVIYHTFADRKQHIDSALQQAINIVEITTTDQAQLISETKSFLQSLATLPSVINLESPECSVALADILKLNGKYVNLGIPRADGELLCNARPLNKPVNVADRPYIQQALATRGFSTGNFQVDRATGVTSINFAYPVIHPVTDETLGLAVAVVSLEWWSKRLSQSRLPEKTVAYITDHEQKIIAAYPNDSKLLGSDILSSQANLLGNSLALNQESKMIRSADNNLRIFVSKPLFDSGGDQKITISVGIPIEQELSAINSRSMKTGALLLFLVILMFFIADWVIKKSVLDPIKVLLQSAKDLELGKSTVNHYMHGSTELVELQQRFTSMAKTRLDVEHRLINSQISLQESETRLQKKAEQQKEVFAIVSHELRTPLSSIKMMSNDMGLNQIEPHGSDIDSSVDALLSILDDMRIVMEPSLAKKSLPIVDSPYSVAERTLKSLASVLADNGMELHFTGDHISNKPVQFYAQVFRQIITNLVKNSAIHSKGTDIWLDISGKRVSGNRNAITLTIQDNGLGIGMEKQQHLYEPFVRGNSDADGTGLGLFIVKESTDILGGNLRLFEGFQGGTGFELSFETDSSEEVIPPARENLSIRGLNILLAEDQLTIQKLTCKQLEMAGCNVIGVLDGQQALDAFSDHSFDIVLTDINMPNINGYEFTQSLRQSGYKGIIIGITAANVGHETEKLLSVGANAVIQKPISIKVLKEVLSEIQI